MNMVIYKAKLRQKKDKKEENVDFFYDLKKILRFLSPFISYVCIKKMQKQNKKLIGIIFFICCLLNYLESFYM